MRSALGASDVSDVSRLTGGASRATWRATVDGRRVIAQRQAAGSERDMRTEAAVLRAAQAAGVPVPSVLACLEAPDGVVTLATELVPGETIARRVLRDERYAAARERLIGQIARAMARLHSIGPVERSTSFSSRGSARTSTCWRCSFATTRCGRATLARR